MDSEEQACWLLLVFKSRLSQRIVHEIIEQWCIRDKRTLKAFFAADSQEWIAICHLDERTVTLLQQARAQLAEQRIVVEKLATHAIGMTTMLDVHYPRVLKATLSATLLPPVLFYIGDLQLLQRITIAIIGSRKAGELSLAFTHIAASYLAEHGANVISGYAHGVDHAAYDGATSVDGCTTIVLPLGIHGLSKAHMSELQPRIECGKVLVLSQFHPNANWLVSRAMARNKVVTGLAQIVIVAESNMHGGTWDAANGALAQKRPLYVCQAIDAELLPGNAALIQRGGCSLYWSAEEAKGRSMTDVVLSPLLDESNRLRQKQEYTSKLSHMLREHTVLEA